MTTTIAKVIDHTKNTDANVHGGKMAAGDPSGMILHATASKSEAGDESWLSHYHDNPVSINQLVHRDGTIIQILPNDTIAWHAGLSVLNGRTDCNEWCIGVEICNADDGVEPYTDAQYESVAQTVAYNCARFHIMDRQVATHAAVALPAGRKRDPYHFDLVRMWKRVGELRQNWPFSDITMWCCNE
jgi:N-acetyl-anhydromuramyl-L-alanine amidase AmpD